MTKIYFLHNGDFIPLYIGKTVNHLKQRLSNHKIKKSSPNLLIELIDEVPSTEWRFWEEFYITLFRGWGFNLTNKNSGGCGSTFATFKTKEKISNALKGKPKPKGFGQIISNKNKNQKRTKDFCILQSKIHLGNKRTDEFKTHMSKLMKDKKWTPTTTQIESIKTANKTPIIQYDLEGNFIKEWGSQTECANFLGVKKNSVNNVLRGYCNTCKGYTFKYKN